ncbi:MAG TPA: single-stranded-DNA-specific exonuclease RecJ [Nitrospirota bacterium]|nr:single-stranded-DNA-specific exonuclease RecJ [Nitrospirota bacterium]
MSMKWVLTEPDAHIADMLSDRAGLHPLIARLMVNRGISDPTAARSFLSCDLSTVSDPAMYCHMDRAVSRVRRAIAANEKIVVFGDYDVDGVTGTSLLYLVLKGLGAQVCSYIPDRMSEGYGLNTAALAVLRESGASLVITVDCGITAYREAVTARTLGLDLIITDHHELDYSDGLNDSSSSTVVNDLMLPDALAILHPVLVTSESSAEERLSVSGLTGVGIAFKFAQALLEAKADGEQLRPYLDLVTLGTVADVGKVIGENRILIKHGLDLLSSSLPSQRPGVAALKAVTGLHGKKISAGTVGFTIAPRINASGRLERADMAFRLLTTDSLEEAGHLASALDAMNKERQTVEESIWNDARRQCLQTDISSIGAIVLSSGAWHTGVIGIVSSRIVEEFYRPTALISVQNGVGKGSARSIHGFDLYKGLHDCRDLLLGFGGHKYAAGFTIAPQNIPLFRERLSAIVMERMGPQGFTRSICVDGAVMLDDLTMDLVREMEKLAPFGQGNPEPRLGTRGLEVVSSRIVGSNHLKLRLKQGGGTAIGAIAFNFGSMLGKQVRDGSRLAAVFTPRLNAWNGTTTVELEIRDIKMDK